MSNTTQPPVSDLEPSPAAATAVGAPPVVVKKKRKKPLPRALPDGPDIVEFRGKYGWSPIKTKPPSLDVDDMSKFVANSFAEWGWFTKEEFTQEVRKLRKEGAHAKFIQQMKQERRFFVRKLQAEYKFTRPAMLTGLKYSRKRNAFTARVAYKKQDEHTGAIETNEEDIFVEEAWVREELEEEVVNHVMNRSGGLGYTNVPTGKEILLHKSPVVRVRYIPARERTIIDAEECRRVDEIRDLIVRARTIKERLSRNGMSQAEILDLPVEEVLKMTRDAFRKEVHVPASWTAQLANKKEERIQETYVRRNFGDAFADELIKTKSGFVDVPVGDFKDSTLKEYPNLLDPNAPVLRFRQFDGMDQCVTKSLASVLYNMNFIGEAKAINDFGEREVSGGMTFVLQRTLAAAKEILPKWIQGKRIDNNYDWKNCLVDHGLILVGAMIASDGNLNHAVSIHGGYIYDANEETAIPLSQEGLDYCTSTSSKKSQFIAFRTVLLFQYKGTKKSRLEQMTKNRYEINILHSDNSVLLTEQAILAISNQ